MKIKSLCLNLLNNYCYFYDWLSIDPIKTYHDLLLYKVSSKTINDLIAYDIRLLDNSLTYKEKIIVFTDTYNYIAISFDENGYSKLKSSLLFKDELYLSDRYDRLKNIRLKYQKLCINKKNNESRFIINIRNSLIDKLNTMLKENDIEKIKYLYYEWFNQKGNDINIMYKKMINKVNKKITDKECYIFDLLNNVLKVV